MSSSSSRLPSAPPPPPAPSSSLKTSKRAPVTCKNCSKVFSYSNISKHRKYCANDFSNAFECELCDMLFIAKSDLKKHVDGVHHNLRPHPCPIEGCASAFKQKPHLTAHLNGADHNNIKSHICSLCHKGFTRKEHLGSHRLAVHGIHPNSGSASASTPQSSAPETQTPVTQHNSTQQHASSSHGASGSSVRRPPPSAPQRSSTRDPRMDISSLNSSTRDPRMDISAVATPNTPPYSSAGGCIS